jgi:hypothetical protein
VKQHLGRQSGVQQVEVNLLNGKVDIMPKDDGQIEPAQLLKATYDSGVSVAEMDITATGKIVKDTAGVLSLQVKPNQAFVIVPNEMSRTLEALAGTETQVTIRGQLYEKPPGKKKVQPELSLKLTILEVQKQE